MTKYRIVITRAVAKREVGVAIIHLDENEYRKIMAGDWQGWALHHVARTIGKWEPLDDTQSVRLIPESVLIEEAK